MSEVLEMIEKTLELELILPTRIRVPVASEKVALPSGILVK